MGASQSSGAPPPPPAVVNAPPPPPGTANLPRKYFTGWSRCDPETEALAGFKLDPLDPTDTKGLYGFGASAVCAKADGTTRTARFAIDSNVTYTNATRGINTAVQACDPGSYAVGVGLVDYQSDVPAPNPAPSSPVGVKLMGNGRAWGPLDPMGRVGTDPFSAGTYDLSTIFFQFTRSNVTSIVVPAGFTAQYWDTGGNKSVLLTGPTTFAPGYVLQIGKLTVTGAAPQPAIPTVSMHGMGLQLQCAAVPPVSNMDYLALRVPPTPPADALVATPAQQRLSDYDAKWKALLSP